MHCYFERVDESVYRATAETQGAWNTDEQHIAPALGLLAHALEQDHATRHATPLRLSRVSFDILGTLPIDTVDLYTRVIRPGRTIELLEASLSMDGRVGVTARGWFLQESDTPALAGSALPAMPPRAGMERWNNPAGWRGRFITTADVFRRQSEPGRAWSWIRPQLPLLDDVEVSPTARLLGLIDIANGVTPRVSPDEVVFPNVDLTVHLLRAPETEWIGFDTTVSFGPTGLGLTHTVLHDELGPIGTSQQALTVRPLR